MKMASRMRRLVFITGSNDNLHDTQGVAGSSPARPTNFSLEILKICSGDPLSPLAREHISEQHGWRNAGNMLRR
jgi:hypothetical protein